MSLQNGLFPAFSNLELCLPFASSLDASISSITIRAFSTMLQTLNTTGLKTSEETGKISSAFHLRIKGVDATCNPFLSSTTQLSMIAKHVWNSLSLSCHRLCLSRWARKKQNRVQAVDRWGFSSSTSRVNLPLKHATIFIVKGESINYLK